MTDTVVAYFLYASGIILREGLEALLVVIALAAGARQAGVRDRSRDIYGGALAAVAASIALAWAINHLIGDNASDTLEGAFQFLAAATLFFVSSWLTAKSQSDRWVHFVTRKVESAERSRVPALALGLTAFLAVIREGAETIVFFQALTAGATQATERHAVIAGIAAGGVLLTAVFVVLTRASYRIPIGRFFMVTSVLLYGLAVVFVGQGVASWQEANFLSATFIDHVPTVVAIGLYPTVESIAAQALLIAFAAVVLLVPRGGQRSAVTDAAETRPTLAGYRR
ncbi:MAG TPA: FTR1 family protein [Candidatus Binataceae bacterium]|nr:FTR1 family protein [Candidatus Binataceae bacterium]